MDVNQFGPRLSFFLDCGLDIEYLALARVCRKIWAVGMRDVFGADRRAQILKLHTQTSGRSLIAAEWKNNITRTALELTLACMNATNSCHSNAADEPFTTPSEEYATIAAHAQAILLEESGLFRHMMNPMAGSPGMKAVGDAVEAAILEEFREIDRQGGVQAAVERRYQRSQIQASAHQLERQIYDGTRPVVGLNRYANPDEPWPEISMIRTRQGSQAAPVGPPARFREAPRGRLRTRAGRAGRRGRLRRQRVRGTHRHCGTLFPGPDHHAAARNRRPLPPDGVTGVSGGACLHSGSHVRAISVMIGHRPMEAIFSDPAALKRLSPLLQWSAIGLVALGALAQTAKHLVDLRERSLSAALAEANDDARSKKEAALQAALAKEAALQAALAKAKSDYDKLAAASKDWQDRVSKAEAQVPKFDERGRIVAGPNAAYPTEFSEGIAKAERMLSTGDLDGAYQIAKDLLAKKDDFGLAYFILAIVEGERKHVDISETYLKKAMSCGVDDWHQALCLYSLAEIALDRGQEAASYDYIRQAHAKAPNDPHIQAAYEKLPDEYR